MKVDKTKLKSSIIKLTISAVIIAGICVGVYFLYKHFGLNNISADQIKKIVQDSGAYGAIIFILISFLQVTFIPIPSTVTIVAGSYLFGAMNSFWLSYIGILLGSFLAFFLGRLIGKPFVYWVVGSKDTVEKNLIKLKGKEKILLFFMFLFPFFPDDALCAIAGITNLSWIAFILMQLLTRAIAIFGNILFLSGEFIPFDEPWGISLIVILSILGIVGFIICMKYSEQIQNYIIKIIDKIFLKMKNKSSKNVNSNTSTSIDQNKETDNQNITIENSIKDTSSPKEQNKKE